MSPKFYIGFMTACVSWSAYSYQISPNPNAPGSFITISTDDAENSTDFLNSGDIFIDEGVFQNNGVLTNSAGTYWQKTAQILNRGWVTNFGVLNNENQRGPLPWQSSYASLRNQGWLDNFGVINNSGSMYLAGGGAFGIRPVTYNHPGATLNNRGIIDVASFVALENVGGVINNELPGSSILINTYGKFYNTGVVNNAGRIGASYGASLENLGRINNAGQLSGSVSNHAMGGIVNAASGVISDGDVGNDGLVSNQGGLVRNDYLTRFVGTGRYEQSSGQTIVNGEFSQQSIDIQGGDLCGQGTINGNVLLAKGATLSLGGYLGGALKVNGDVSSGADLFFKIREVDLTVGLSVHGDLAFDGGSATVDFLDGFAPSAGQSWELMRADRISGLDELVWHVNGLASGLNWNVRRLDSGAVRLSITSAVPESDAWALFLSGLAMLFVWRRAPGLHARAPSSIHVKGEGAMA